MRIRQSITLVILLLVMMAPGCSTSERLYINNPLGEGVGSDNNTPVYVTMLSQSVNATYMYDHSAYHELGGGDVLSVIGLSGLLADDQHVLDAEVVDAVEAASPLTLPAFTLGDTLTLNGQVFDAGGGSAEINTTGVLAGLTIKGTATDHGTRLKFQHKHTTPDLNGIIGEYVFYSYDHAVSGPVEKRFGVFRLRHTNIGDGTEEATFYYYAMAAGEPDNLAMTLSGAGVLAVDDSYDTFDDKDDAKLLKEGVKEGKKEVLEAIGVLKKKYKVDADGAYIKDKNGELIHVGYMLNVQDFLKLLSGGVYQNRDRIDLLEERIINLEERIITLEKLLKNE